MPNYKNAADVRAQHPGVYDDLTDAQIEQGLAKPALQTSTDDTFKMADPQEPFYGSMARYGRDELRGAKAALSPSSLWEGLKNIVPTALHGLTQDIPALVKDPSLLKEAPSAALDFLLHPKDVGATLAQTAAAEAAPGLLKTAAVEGPGLVGRGASAIGRGSEIVGSSSVLRKAQKLAPLELLTGHPYAAAISAAAPEVLTRGGQLAQKAGGALEGLTESLRNRFPKTTAPAPTDPWVAAQSATRQSTEVPGSSWAGDASAQPEPADIPAHAAGEDTPFTHERFVNDMKRTVGEDPNGGLTQSPAFRGLQEAVTRATETPIQKFYRENPGAATGGEGRMTGQFEEGNGGLSDVAAGNVEPRLSPSLLDKLSEMSGRALSPEDAQAILNKYRQVKTVE